MQALTAPRVALRPAAQGRSRRLTVSAVALPTALPGDYGYVIASVAFTAGMVQWQAIRVAIARRAASLPYPKTFAEGDDEASARFNCSYRAHYNTLENLSGALAMQALLGLVYPRVAAGLGAAWALGRIVYTLGYSTGDPAKRAPGGAASGLAYIALILTTLVVGVRSATGL